MSYRVHTVGSKLWSETMDIMPIHPQGLWKTMQRLRNTIEFRSRRGDLQTAVADKVCGG